jgi:endonuclease YncB( thermonuclease family)
MEAWGRLRGLLPKGSIAWVATDSQKRDTNGRWLMYVWGADGRLANYLMAVDGYARVESTPPNTRLDEVFTEAERKARAQFGGMWSVCLD